MTEESLIHKGHRQRMRDKFVTHGGRVMQTYELLEMLLFYIIPYKNTNPIAKRLMLKFGDIDSVFSANREQLMEVDGVGGAVADFIIKVGELMTDSAEKKEESAFDDYNTVGRFLVEKLSDSKEHESAVMLFDNKMKLIDFKILFKSDFSSGGVKVDEIIDFALRNRAAAVITAHSHPYGPLFPTPGDMATNESVVEMLLGVGIIHIEHYIVSGTKYMGITNQLSIAFEQFPEIERFCKSREES